MSVFDEYRSKLRTPDEAVKLIKDGDWVDYGSNVGFPVLLDAALARGIVEKRGSWLSFGDSQLAQGSLGTIDYLREHPEVTAKIVELVKAAPSAAAAPKKK